MPQKQTVISAPVDRIQDFFPDGGTPAWEVAYLFPPQGSWTEDDYFNLESLHDTHPLVELSNGRVEVLPVPTQTHQMILVFLFEMLKAFTAAHAPGMVLFTGLKIRLRKIGYREPDIIYMKAENAHRRHEKYWDGADLVMEIISPAASDRKRDLKDKPREYARAGIPEYWIIDPQLGHIQVLTLQGKAYQLHGQFGPGTQATSVLLPGFSVDVDAVLALRRSEDEG